ncbi:MAG TPA: hypothetical protein PK052_00960 [Anaerohalosphaeraceae bacterium]|nr:hypothetical protein [Anaerohalosphaeraceae bacterium]HOL30526.1 hypothetical protein [Anaerohalosphaeraceae bacterium]HPO69975.1 hypothetical protein [Anaerohalosphaeraceae bacterium]
MNSKELYLHIGMPKTATSALQRFFSINRDLLAQKGIAYPAAGGLEAHHRIGWALRLKRGFRHWWFDRDVGTCDFEWQQISRQCVLPRNLISTETFWGCTREDVAFLKDLSRSYHTTVVVYLRRQDFFKESLYAEKVKMGVEKRTDVKIGAGWEKFALWERTFGRDSIIVRPYERGQFYKGSIYADFLNSVWNAELTEEYKIPADLNLRLHRIVLEYKRLVNHLPLSLQQIYAAVEPLQRISELFFQKGKSSDFVFSPALRRREIEKNRKFYHYLAREYCGRDDGMFFYEPEPSESDLWRPYRDLLEEDAAEINRCLADAAPTVLGVIAAGIVRAQTAADPQMRLAARRLSPGIASEYFKADAVSAVLMPPIQTASQQTAAFDDLYASRMWEVLQYFRPLYNRLPSNVIKCAVATAAAASRLTVRKKTGADMAGRSRLYVHIGMVKTGTSALQRFLGLNRELLQKMGIFYPKSPENLAAHHRLVWSIMTAQKVKKPDWPDDLQHPRREWEQLRRQISSNSGILSSEHFLGFSGRQISQLKSLLRDYDVQIVVYWRRRDGLEDSWYNQRIKGGEITNRPQFLTNLPAKCCLDRWADVFGKEHLCVRPYERGQLYRGDVAADFLHHILGLELTGEFVLPEKEVNTRLHRVVVEYKRLVNLLPLSRSEKRSTVNPLRAVSDYMIQQGRKDYSVFSPAQRLELLARYAEESAAIARDYLGRPDGQLFYDPLPDPNEDWQPYEELLEEDAKQINAYLEEHYPAALETIIQGLLKAFSAREENARQAALRLLPGIESQRIRSVLGRYLVCFSKDVKAMAIEDGEMDMQQVRRAGMIAVRIYRRMPSFLQRPALRIVRRMEHKMQSSVK